VDSGEAERYGIKFALDHAFQHWVGQVDDLFIRCDSTFAIGDVQGVVQGNQVPIFTLDVLIAERWWDLVNAGVRVVFEHVQGHSESRGNAIADYLAGSAMRRSTNGASFEEEVEWMQFDD
jgi:ribonuclease HI